jgi:ABC-type Na+ efflux pump permease subunit
MNEIKEFLTNLTSLELAIFTITFLIIVMVLLIIYIISNYLEKSPKQEKKISFDLEDVAHILEEENKKPREIVTGYYEKEQEENAIISYEELLEQTTKLDMNTFKSNNASLDKEDYTEEEAPISYEDFKKLDKEENLELTKEIVFLKDLKTFRAGLK